MVGTLVCGHRKQQNGLSSEASWRCSWECTFLLAPTIAQGFFKIGSHAIFGRQTRITEKKKSLNIYPRKVLSAMVVLCLCSLKKKKPAECGLMITQRFLWEVMRSFFLHCNIYFILKYV